MNELTSKVLGIEEPPVEHKFKWKPLADITLHELALCMPYIISPFAWITPHDLASGGQYFRHFEIINQNTVEL